MPPFLCCDILPEKNVISIMQLKLVGANEKKIVTEKFSKSKMGYMILRSS